MRFGIKLAMIQLMYNTYFIKLILNKVFNFDLIYFKLNWYTKRLTLAAIYKSTELFMLQDKSENFKETYEFLDNRFNDLFYFSSVNTQVK